MFRYAPILNRLHIEAGRIRRFTLELSHHRSEHFAHLVALLGDVREARDALEETILFDWRRSADLQDGTDFGASVWRTAHYQVFDDRRETQRDGHLCDEGLLNPIVVRPRAVKEASPFILGPLDPSPGPRTAWNDRPFVGRIGELVHSERLVFAEDVRRHHAPGYTGADPPDGEVRHLEGQ